MTSTDLATSPDLVHLIITRFNVRFPQAKGRKPDALGLQPAWLERRFDLFEAYCLPSVMAQTDQNFSWWIYIDSDTPQTFIDRARADTAAYPNIVLRFCDVYEDDRLVNDIRAEFPHGHGWLITSRLDNDDGLHPDFVKSLHGEVRQDRREALNFLFGIVIRNGRTYLHRHESNAFLSLAEPLAGCVTVLSVQHMDMRALAPIRQITSVPGWLQVIHENNISNRVRGRRVASTRSLREFTWLAHTSWRPQAESRAAIVVDNALYGAWRSARDFAITMIKYPLRVARRSSVLKRQRPRAL